LGDDYCTLHYAKRFGVLRSAWFWYLTWTGVYSRNVTNEILVLGERIGMWFIIPGLLIVWLGASVFVIASLLKKDFSSKYKFWVSTAFGVTFLSVSLMISPMMTRSVYWWSGMNAYTMPLVFMMLYAAMYAFFVQKMWKRNANLLWVIASFLMAFFIGGFSETFSPILFSSLTFALVLSFVLNRTNAKRQHISFISAGVIGGLVALIVMIAAPGNAVRQSNFTERLGVLSIIEVSFLGYFGFLKTILMPAEKILGVLGAGLGAVWLGTQSNDGNAPKLWLAPAVMVIGFGFAFLSFPPAVFGLGEVPPGRILIIPANILVASLLSAGFLTGKWIKSNLQEMQVLRTSLVLGLLVTFMLGFSGWKTSQTLYEQRVEYINFAQLWDKVDGEIRAAKASGADEVRVPLLNNWANIPIPTDNPNYWITRCYSLYYDLQIIGPPLQ
jgi:hypothetical protein